MPKEVKAPALPTETYTVMLDDQPIPVEASSMEEAIKLAKRKQSDLTAENTDGKR